MRRPYETKIETYCLYCFFRIFSCGNLTARAIPSFNLNLESLLDWIDDGWLLLWQKHLQMSGEANGASYVSLAQLHSFVVPKQGTHL